MCNDDQWNQKNDFTNSLDEDEALFGFVMHVRALECRMSREFPHFEWCFGFCLVSQLASRVENRDLIATGRYSHLWSQCITPSSHSVLLLPLDGPGLVFIHLQSLMARVTSTCRDPRWILRYQRCNMSKYCVDLPREMSFHSFFNGFQRVFRRRRTRKKSVPRRCVSRLCYVPRG